MRMFKLFAMGFIMSTCGVNQYAAAQGNQVDEPAGAKRAPTPAPDLSDYYGDIHESPWFSNPSIRKHLSLSTAQYDQLNSDYRKAWNQYNDGVKHLDPKLTDAERIEAREALRDAFHRDLANSADSTLTDRASRQRYEQLTVQYRGPGALNDPAVQRRLELNDTQRTRFKQLDRDWNQRMATWHRDYGDDSAQVLKRFNSGRTEIQEGLKSSLTRDQQEAWHSLSGEPYEMPPEVYFQDKMKTRPFSP